MYTMPPIIEVNVYIYVLMDIFLMNHKQSPIRLKCYCGDDFSRFFRLKLGSLAELLSSMKEMSHA